jgi:hypothetical protein
MLISSMSRQTESYYLKYTAKNCFRLALGISTNVLTTQQTQVLQITNISTEQGVDIYVPRKGNQYGWGVIG